MEDGFPLFDHNDDAARQEQRLKEFYGDFSDNARKRLLVKNVLRPESVYDILYPRTREVLMAKNVPFNTDLEEDAKLIRDRLIAKIVIEETDLEKISADFRKSMLARAKIQDDRNKLTRDAESFRKSLLSKNTSKETDIEQDSAQFRRNNLTKNNQNLTTQKDIDDSSPSFRENNLSKNTSKDQDLLRDSESFRSEYRKNDIHKNVPIDNDLEKDSAAFRNKNLSKNSTNPQSIDDTSDTKRKDDLSKNTPKNTNLEENSISFRKNDLHKNTSKDQNLLRDSENLRNEFRKNDLHKNVEIKADLEKDSAIYRRNNLSNNTKNNKEIDLEADSAQFRNDSLSANVPNESDLEADSAQYRIDDVHKNALSKSDIEKDSAQFREDDLSANAPNESDLESDSAQFRSDDLSANKPNTSDLESDSAQFREDDLSANKPNTSDLEEDSSIFRKDDLSANKANESDLERDSAEFRKSDLSANKPSASDLEVDSTQFRKDDLAANTSNVTDLEKDSEDFREDDLSANKLNITDLEADSVLYREDDLSLNVLSISNLEVDSIPFRLGDLSFNSPNFSDLEVDSVTYREDDLSANVLSTSDLIVDSTPFLFSNLSANVLSESDLQADSEIFREDDLSANVPKFSDLQADSEEFREDDLSANSPNFSNLSVDSTQFRVDNLASNVPNSSNIASESGEFREDNLSSNVTKKTNLLTDSDTFRNDALAGNSTFGLVGVNVQGAGTSAFLGVSRVFTQGILVRQLLLSKNKPNPSNIEEDGREFRRSNLAKQVWVPQAAGVGASLEYGSSNTHFDLLSGTREATGGYGFRAGYSTTSSPTKRAIEAQARWTDNFNFGLQFQYGNFVKNPDGSIDTTTVNYADKSFGVDVTSPQGGQFDSPTTSVDSTYWYAEGYVTENIRLYNLERNSYNIQNVQVGGLDGFGNLASFEGDSEFQGLVASTIGSLNVRQSVGTQAGTNSTPLSVITANGGKYFPGIGDLMRPASESALGTAESMMAKTVLGNPYEDEDFLAGRRGVKHIINTIKGSSASAFASNYDPQNNTAYIIGANRDGSPRVSRQRYTIDNPYAPKGAGKLIFFIKNYASNEQFFFPPYIQSIQNTENASWNSTNFLGRPEAIYTYNNSSRDASISFYVLTDYTQSVDIGRDWSVDGAPKITASIAKHFTQHDKNLNDDRKKKLEQLALLKQEQVQASADINEKLEQNNAQQVNLEVGDGVIESTSSEEGSNTVKGVKSRDNQLDRKKSFETRNLKNDESILQERWRESQKAINDADGAIASVDEDFNSPTNYSEAGNTYDNIYNINITKKERENGEIVCKPEDTINRINTMKETLMFQPAYFSGDKVDFVRKVEFLSKLTRPAAAEGGASGTTGTGFSFTKPPVCHIHLGDWWNHDIIVNSVSFDYADAPWTLEGGRVQPMWALVSIDFNIIGPYQSFNARPPLATDAGGMYSPLGGISKA